MSNHFGGPIEMPQETAGNGLARASERANPAERHVEQFRGELRQLRTLLRRSDDQPVKTLAASLDRHFLVLQSDISRMHRNSVSLADQLAREQQEREKSVQVTESIQPLPEPEARPDIEPERGGVSVSKGRGAWPVLFGVAAIIACIAVFWLVSIHLQADNAAAERRRADGTSSIPVGDLVDGDLVDGGGESRGEHQARHQEENLESAVRRSVARAVEFETDDFSRGAEQLYSALQKFRDPPERVLTRVRYDNAVKGIYVCPFEWNDGSPSLVFGNANDGTKLGAVLRRCAEAVDRE